LADELFEFIGFALAEIHRIWLEPGGKNEIGATDGDEALVYVVLVTGWSN
jgi:hypothetical protein